MAKSRFVPERDELVPTRLSLLERLRDLDDHGSWQEFFDVYWKLIYCAAIKGGLSDSEAEDVVQETIIGIARNMENFRYQPEVCSFKGWLMRVTRCRIVDHLRKSPAGRYSFVPLPHEAPSETEVGEQVGQPVRPEAVSSTSEEAFEDLWDEEWKKNLLDAAMERIKHKVAPEHYQIFYLYCVKGMPARHIGELFGVSLTKIYVVRHRVSRLIKREVRALERKDLRFEKPPHLAGEPAHQRLG